MLLYTDVDGSAEASGEAWNAWIASAAKRREAATWVAGEVFGRIVLVPSGLRGRVLRTAWTSARVNSIFILMPNTLA